MTQMQMTLEEKSNSIFLNRNFLILWLGQLVSKLGDSFFSYAITIWVITTVGLEQLAILMAVSSIPKIILGPIAGTVVDRVNRKTIIWLSDFLRGSLMLCAAFLISMGDFNIYYFYSIFILNGIISTFFDPAISATFPNVVEKSQLSQANSVKAGTNSFSQILGPVIASILLIALGGASKAIPTLIILNAISFFASGFSELFLDVPQLHLKKSRNHDKASSSFLNQLKEGFVYVKSSAMLLHMMIIFAVINFFLVPIFQLILPGVMVDVLNAESWLGLIQSAVAIGFILASVFLSIKKSTTHYKFLSMGLLGLGLSILLLGISIAVAIIAPMGTQIILLSLALITVIIGVSAAITNIKLSTIMQIIVPDEVRGRVFALMNTMVLGLTPLSLALSGLIILKLPLFVQPVLGGFIIVLASILLYKIKELKKY